MLVQDLEVDQRPNAELSKSSGYHPSLAASLPQDDADARGITRISAFGSASVQVNARVQSEMLRVFRTGPPRLWW